jgi:hypothetical protein
MHLNEDGMHMQFATCEQSTVIALAKCTKDQWLPIPTGLRRDFKVVPGHGSPSVTSRDIRSGNPNQESWVRLPNVMAPVVTRLRFQYEYVVGYGRWGRKVPKNVKGPHFTVSLVDAKTGKQTEVYKSPELDTYDYDTCSQHGGWGNSKIKGDGCYSNPVKVDVPVSIKSTEFYVLFRFTNNDRNMHLNEDGMDMKFGIKCKKGGGAVSGLVVANSGQFDGSNDWVEMPALGTYKQMTIDTWIKFKSVRGNHPIINEDAWRAGSLHYQIYNSQFGIDVNGIGDKTFKWQPKAMTWYFISVAYDSVAGQIKLSINNKAIETISMRKGRTIVMNKARIGAWRSNGARSLHGAIYALRIWTKVTDGKDLCANAGTSGLLVNYFFDKATIGKDLSGNNHHCTPNDVTWSKTPDLPTDPKPSTCAGGGGKKAIELIDTSKCRTFFSANNQRYLMKNYPLVTFNTGC